MMLIRWSMQAAAVCGLVCLIGPAQGQAKKVHVNSIGMKMVRIKPGEFLMGQGEKPPKTREEWYERDWDESPAHKVRITKAFFMGATEVTNAQFEQFDPKHKEWRGKFGNSKAHDEPVTHVTWQQAVDFCKWLSKKEGKPYRLPTEAEWEYACRAGTKTLYNTGDTLTAKQANFGPSAAKKMAGPVKVGSYKPNAWGLYDMHGNVAEWCHDWYGPYRAGTQDDPVGRIDGVARIVRGWSTKSVLNRKGVLRYLRCANRSGHSPEDANCYTGFRVVHGEMPASKPLPVPPLPLNQRNVKQTPAPKDGPDAKQPYFVDYAKEKKLAVVQKDAWGPLYAAHNHFSTVTVCPNGDVLAVWYTTVSEGGREGSLAASRLRVGSKKWEPASLFFAIPDCNINAAVLLSDGRRLYHFFAQSLKSWTEAAVCMRISEDSGATWSKPRIIRPRDHRPKMNQTCSAFVARDGTLVLAADGSGQQRVLTSRDRGKTWKLGQGNLRKAAGRSVVHPAVVPTSDGSILAFLRGPNPMPAYSSNDMGKSWQPRPTPFPGIAIGQKAAALRLKSGAILLVSFNNHWSKKAGKIRLRGGGVYAALSLDDGKTWPHTRKIDNLTGYMSVAQAPNGVIYHFGSKMRAAAYNEAWLKKGKPLSPDQ